MSDKICIRELRVDAILGVLPHEREIPQPVIISVEVEIDTRRAAATKELTDTLDYAALATKMCEQTIAGRYLLIETLAEDLARLCFDHPAANGARISVEKPHAVLDAQAVGIHIYREREAFS